ncbi:MAG: hypothetical protein KatS3mg006_0113 [Pyrinomonadaceae bacterium]|nr:MAG: hypothetical protein KatS3mg006_0113 [Pyrinomonadaceae bacterium]
MIQAFLKLDYQEKKPMVKNFSIGLLNFALREEATPLPLKVYGIYVLGNGVSLDRPNALINWPAVERLTYHVPPR